MTFGELNQAFFDQIISFYKAAAYVDLFRSSVTCLNSGAVCDKLTLYKNQSQNLIESARLADCDIKDASISWMGVKFPTLLFEIFVDGNPLPQYNQIFEYHEYVVLAFREYVKLLQSFQMVISINSGKDLAGWRAFIDELSLFHRYGLSKILPRELAEIPLSYANLQKWEFLQKISRATMHKGISLLTGKDLK